MAAKKRKIARRVQQRSVWQALNEPIAIPNQEFTRSFFVVAAAILLMIWMVPYWNTTAGTAPHTQVAVSRNINYVSLFSIVDVTLDPNFGQYLTAGTESVAGAQESDPDDTGSSTESGEVGNYLNETAVSLLEFYIINIEAPAADAIVEVLDVSDFVIATAEYYEPGVTEVWNTWLGLLAGTNFE